MKKIYRMSESQFEAIVTKKKVYNDGYEANRSGNGLEKNPYEKGASEHEAWKDGWLAAEANSQAHHDDAMLSKEIGESEEIVNEVTDSDNVFRSEIKGRYDIDTDIRFDQLLPDLVKPGTRGNTIIVDGAEYDPYVSISSAVVTYSIDIEYRSYGIKSISVIPISASFIGTLEMTGDDDSYEKDIELEFDRTGLKNNTLSGVMNLGDKTVNIPNINTEVVFEAERETNNTSIFVNSVELILQPNKIIFKY